MNFNLFVNFSWFLHEHDQVMLSDLCIVFLHKSFTSDFKQTTPEPFYKKKDTYLSHTVELFFSIHAFLCYLCPSDGTLNGAPCQE